MGEVPASLIPPGHPTRSTARGYRLTCPATGGACPRSHEYAAQCANTFAAQAAAPESLVDHSSSAEYQESFAGGACTTHTPGGTLPSRASVESGQDTQSASRLQESYTMSLPAPAPHTPVG